MTLLVGVLCSNGAVIAADRQATHGAMGLQTVGQSVTKVQVIHGEALYATSGHKGLGQQLCAIVEGKQQEFKNQGYDRNIVKLQEALRPIIDAGFQTARNAAGVIGNAVAANDCMCGGLLAAGFKDGLKLIEITPQIAVEYMTLDMPFIIWEAARQVPTHSSDFCERCSGRRVFQHFKRARWPRIGPSSTRST